MSGNDSLRFLAQLHGHLGWLAAAALLHPAILLRDPSRWVGPAAAREEDGARPRHGLAIAFAVGLVTASAAAGLLVYGPYRETVRSLLFASAPSTGWLFERKEHLAAAAAALAWAGVLAAVGALRSPSDPVRAALGRAAHRAFVGAAVLTFITAALGTWVASVRTF